MGVHCDSRMNFTHHLNYAAEKATKICGMLCKLIDILENLIKEKICHVHQ